MDRVTRHLVFQLPETRHDYSDAHQADSEEDVFGSTPHSSQRVESSSGWKRRLKSSSNFLDDGKDLWTSSPDRDSKLDVVKSGSLYDLRAYKGERKPSKLYEEDEQDQRRVPPPNISPEKAKELEDERREIIRSQVMRKSSTIAERWSSMDELSSINSSTGTFTSSFALSFDRPSSRRAVTPVDSENIDTEQINFSAARQQFLMLEKTNPGSFFSPAHQAMSPKPESMTKVSRQEWHSPEMASKAARGQGGGGASSQSRTDKNVYQVYSVSYKTPVKEEIYAPSSRLYPNGKMSTLTKASSREDLDSGLGEMYNEANAGYGSDGSTSNEVFNGLVELRSSSNGLDKETKTSHETPIEREIRRAMEREENLWKERGVQRLTSGSEMVEIQTKPLFSMQTSPGPGRKGKDNGRASLYVQREIEQETKREEDLRKQGRLLGTYDRGTQQELDERRRVFEREEAPSQKPPATRKAEEQRSWVNEFVVEQPLSHSSHLAEGARGGRSLPSYPTSITLFQTTQPRFVNSEKSQDQPRVSQRASTSTGKRRSEDSWAGRLPSSTPSPTSTAVLPRKYFSLSFWNPKFYFLDEMGTQNPLRREDGREEQYKLRTWKPQTSALIEEEIRSDLQREEELQEQRRRRQQQLLDGCSLVSSDQEGSRSRHSSGGPGAGVVLHAAESAQSLPGQHRDPRL
ncbi:mitotic interactor and substrate of PLK1 isoform X2 [Indicator indicator]|uniref:mitotic interactor and substrate of PLK1 isoform X2 n=1 Tax=Indicator indicator TaxID=1002788 RepID=UPI0023E014F6|nr:mitotic interactor and substrate of PLK1 isoform X2 [Indicator indicator]